jgi:hypothetical protein
MLLAVPERNRQRNTDARRAIGEGGKKIASIARQLASLLAATREVIARYQLASVSHATTTRE